MYDFEVPSYSDEPWGTYKESLLDNYRDEADEAVYAAAVARFESDWERNPQAQSCLQAVARRAEGRVGGGFKGYTRRAIMEVCKVGGSVG